MKTRTRISHHGQNRRGLLPQETRRSHTPVRPEGFRFPSACVSLQLAVAPEAEIHWRGGGVSVACRHHTREAWRERTHTEGGWVDRPR